MKRYFAFVLTFALFTTLAFAHGKEAHIMGTVTKVSAGSITVQTTDDQTKTVTVTPKTRFLKSGEETSLKDLSVGDRVVITADDHGDNHIQAVVVKFGAPKKAASR